MPSATEPRYDFEQRWPGLTQPHVRALAWLLDSPDLLDVAHPRWQGRIAHLPAPDAAWLHALDADPVPLLEALGARPYTRLGLYAEKLMAFWFAQQGKLLAHGLQVRNGRNQTVGEFDILLDAGDGSALHLELATKFYLLAGVAPDAYDALVGPNLADSLGAKMRKIVQQQLALAAHPSALGVLPRPVSRAQALVKGWLFYPDGTVPGLEGIGADHCRGSWVAASDLARLDGEHFVILPRIEWLAPCKTRAGVLAAGDFAAAVTERFAQPAMPMLAAAVREENGWWVESARAFIVPDDWRARAAQRLA